MNKKNLQIPALMRGTFLYVLVVNSILLVTCFLSYVILSHVGNTLKADLTEKVEEIFTEDWYLNQHIPVHIPLQQIVVFTEDGEVSQCYPVSLDKNVDQFVKTYSTSKDPDQINQIKSALGGWLEPLSDRYPYIGRTPTFLLEGYKQENGWIVVVALWRPLLTRLTWASYAALIYLYLSYWIIAPIAVYLDARRRTKSPLRWAVFAAFANIIGVVIYFLLVRRKELIE